ncbi:hypothetical protein G9A89_014039 [Geosiphon pyriformis]|nr:hypothetical protein G9A89_014039 [Geosiphon pyriformis]
MKQPPSLIRRVKDQKIFKPLILNLHPESGDFSLEKDPFLRRILENAEINKKVTKFEQEVKKQE